MFKNDYGAVIEKWKVDLIISRARRLGFRRQDLEDAQQQIVIALLAFEFDAERSNGATEETAVTALIDHQLLTLRRTRERYGRRVSGTDDELRDDNALAMECLEAKHLIAANDVETVMARLSPVARQVCSALADGLSLNEISQRLGVGWHTVERQVRGIRQCFEQLGIDDAVLA